MAIRKAFIFRHGNPELREGGAWYTEAEIAGHIRAAISKETEGLKSLARIVCEGTRVHIAGTSLCNVCGKHQCQKGCQVRELRERVKP